MVFFNLAITSGVLALIAGILVLIWPKFLRYAIGIYLVILGLIQIFGNYIAI